LSRALVVLPAAALALLLAPAAAPAAPVPSVAAGASAVVRVPDFERSVLPNGLTLVVMRQPEVPLIAFTLVLRGGARAEPADRAGVAALTAGLLEKGAGRRNAYEFAAAVEGAGGSFGASAGVETLRVTGQFLARDRDLMLELLADALRRPRFDAAEFEALRRRQIEFIKAAKDSDPSSLIDSYGRGLLFGAHPYARPVSGSERSLAVLGIGDVRAYARAHVGADRATLVITGDVDPAWARAAVRRAFGDWARAPQGLAPLTEPARATGRRVLLVDSPGSSQAYFWIGNVGVARRDPDRAAIDVVNTLYGGRFTSTLNTELRVKSGLSYGARSSFTRGSVAGEFAIRSFTVVDNARQAMDLALDTLDRLHRDGVGDDALDSARRYLLGQFPLGYETASQWGGALADLEFFGLGREDVEAYGPLVAAVDGAAARAVVARAFPRTSDLAIVLIGDAARLREVAAAYGTVTDLSLTAPDFAPAAGVAGSAETVAGPAH
jgi:predicted Zn-dependent peptidase